MSFVDLISCKYKIVIKTAKADIRRYHTIQTIIVQTAKFLIQGIKNH